MKPVLQYINDHNEDFVRDLSGFLRIPSISAQTRHDADCNKAALCLIDLFNYIGLTVHKYETPGKPIVVAKYTRDKRFPTVLIYGHYDVQPPEPLELWRTPPFEPHIENGRIYARGATDNKGQLLAHIKAVEAHLKVNGELPVNIIFLVEGEEEIASHNLEHFVKDHQEELACDIVLVSDSSQYTEGKPAVCYGLRGICTEEIRIDGANQDLHSGIFGGAVPNPAEVLAQIIAKMKDSQGKVLIPGFYDDVKPLEEWEKKAFTDLHFDANQFKQSLGLKDTHGEEGFSILEQRWARPTLEVNGIFGGYSGEGSKTVLPAWAGAKFSMRLVPDQNPQIIHQKFQDFVTSITPDYVHLSFKESVGAKSVLMPRDAKFVKEAIEAIEQGFNTKPVFIREGGSIPVVITFQEVLGANTLLLGLGQPDDNAHAPNEKFSLADFDKGIKMSAWFLHLAGNA
jgi:acetylornithine deacetylase/succinyl-diaminopimelate desuccinylase-like protein